jgi:hypothetical protein
VAGASDLDLPNDRAVSLADFDRYIEEHSIPEEDYPAAFALWIAEVTGGPCRHSRTPSERSRRTGA